MERNISAYSQWIHAFGKTKYQENLDSIRALLACVDNPQESLKVIHVAGTNGKGSTCNYIAKTLSQTSSCGLFTSPYMGSITESFKINGRPMEDEVFLDYIDSFRPFVEGLIDKGYKFLYFEIMTAIMYKYFSDMKVDVVVCEVGVGGRLDATNIIKAPIASVITTIAMDHIGILGNSIEEIAYNKGGIIKEACPVFVYPQDDRVFKVFKNISRDLKSPLYTFSKEEISVIDMNQGYNHFSFRNYKNVKTSLIGYHQLYNASLALMVLDYFKDDFSLNEDLIMKGLFESENPGRLEFISTKPRILVDGSHNAEAISVLVDSLKALSYKRLILGFSMLKDKDYKYSIERLSKIADLMVITNIDSPERALDLKDLRAEVMKFKKDVVAIGDINEAYRYTKDLAEDGDLVLWCGSLYLVREIKKAEEAYKNK